MDFDLLTKLLPLPIHTTLFTPPYSQLHHIEVTQRTLSGDRTGRAGTSVLRGFPVPATALLLAQILMWTGLLGSLDYGPCGAATLVPNYVLISICCGTFYFLLRCDCMLIAC